MEHFNPENLAGAHRMPSNGVLEVSQMDGTVVARFDVRAGTYVSFGLPPATEPIPPGEEPQASFPELSIDGSVVLTETPARGLRVRFVSKS